MGQGTSSSPDVPLEVRGLDGRSEVVRLPQCKGLSGLQLQQMISGQLGLAKAGCRVLVLHGSEVISKQKERQLPVIRAMGSQDRTI